MYDFDTHVMGFLVGIQHLEAMDIGGGDVFGPHVVNLVQNLARHGLGHHRVDDGKTPVGPAAAMYAVIGQQVQTARIAQQGLRRIVGGIQVPRRTTLEIENPMVECIAKTFDFLDVYNIVTDFVDV